MIAYPVNVANTLWAIVRTSDNALLKRNQKWPREDGQTIVNLDANLVPLLEVTAAQPAYNAATQRLETGVLVIDIPNNTLTTGWNIVAIPQAELDSAAEMAQLKAIYLDLKNHVGTAGERATRLENVVARMMRDQYGS